MAWFWSFNHNRCADDVSSCGDVEQHIFIRGWSDEDRWLEQEVFELLHSLVSLLEPLELVLSLE